MFPYSNVATMTIGADGVLKSEIDLSFKSIGKSNYCDNEVRRQHERATYIPGHHAGKPVESTYNHAWGFWFDRRD